MALQSFIFLTSLLNCHPKHEIGLPKCLHCAQSTFITPKSTPGGRVWAPSSRRRRGAPSGEVVLVTAAHLGGCSPCAAVQFVSTASPAHSYTDSGGKRATFFQNVVQPPLLDLEPSHGASGAHVRGALLHSLSSRRRIRSKLQTG